MELVSKHLFRKKGLPPGSLVYVGDPAEGDIKITLLDYNAKKLDEIAVEDPANLLAHKETNTVSWIRVEGLHQVEKVEALCKTFDIHPLVIEDILNTRQRPKVDDWEDYIFIVMRTLNFKDDSESRDIDIDQLSIVFGKNYLFTFQEKWEDLFPTLKKRLENKKSRIRKMGTDYLAYVLMDVTVDNYFAVMEKIEDKMEELEEELLDNPTSHTLKKINGLKKEMMMVRKSILPLREGINLLKKEESPLIQEEMYMFLGDLYGHVMQILDLIENFRELLSSMHDIYLSSISQRLNEIMKVLTMISTIFIPLSFIAGLYGMNFNTEKSPLNMPELAWYYGYPAVLGVMAAVSLSLLFYFRKKKWI